MLQVDHDHEFVTPTELLAVARELNPSYSESTLRFWRRRGLLPRTEWVNGRRAYPGYAVEQLRTIVRWRARGVRSIDATKVVLWVEGFPVPLDEIRRLLQAFVDSWAASIALFTEEPGHSETVETSVREIAAMRSRSPLPEPMRKRRMKRREREEALIFAAFSLTGQAAEVAKRIHAAPFLDRMLGLDRRRTAVQPLLASADPLYLLRMADPERLHAGAFEADGDELEYVRRLLQISLRYGRAFVALFIRDLGPSARELLAMLTQATPPRMVGPLLGFAITSLPAECTRTETRSICRTCGRAATRVRPLRVQQALEKSKRPVRLPQRPSRDRSGRTRGAAASGGKLPPAGEVLRRRPAN